MLGHFTKNYCTEFVFLDHSVRLVIDEGKRTPTPSGRKVIRRTGGFNLSPNGEMPQIPEELNGSDPQVRKVV